MADDLLWGSEELPFETDDTFEVFTDTFDPIDYTTTMNNTAPMPDLSFTKNSRRALGDIKSNTVLKPNPAQQFFTSPTKTKNPSQSRMPLGQTQGNKLNKMSMPPPGQAPQTDSLEKKPFLSNFKTRPKKASQDGITQFIAQTPTFSTPATHSPSAEDTSLNANGKREHLDPALFPKTQDLSDEGKPNQDVPPVPSWDSFPPIIDDGSKPNHSYAQMIAMAILRSPMGKLTLAQIYKWISDTYSYYNPNDPGWQNSIRHNLSLHKSFRKIVRPKSDPGKGNYWAIEPGAEWQFLKDKPKGRSAPSAENLPVMSTRLEPSVPATAPTSEPTLPPPAPTGNVSQHASSYQIMPSSDATIPEAENTLPEEIPENPTELDPIFDTTSFSPAPPGVCSSPPIPRQDHATGTPRASRHSSRPRKRAAESGPDDSGYISSLDSSAVRPNNTGAEWTSASRPRKKRKNSEYGRAEVEIARLRNSSPFSPTKSRSKATFQPASSSPLRQTTGMRNPLTPPVKMKPATMAPPSVSPNTNLRNHRNLIQNMTQSPATRVADRDTIASWSPKFTIDDRTYTPGLAEDMWPPQRGSDWVFNENHQEEPSGFADDFSQFPF